MRQNLTTIVTTFVLAVTASQAASTQATRDAIAHNQAVSAAAEEQPSERERTPSRPASKATERPQFAFHDIETQLIEATNRARAEHGLPPLEVDYGLMRSARQHAAWMTRSRLLQHTSAMVAENIAMGQESVGEAMYSWMTSPGHRANILSGSYRRIGVAAYRTPEGTIYWCQQFMW